MDTATVFAGIPGARPGRLIGDLQRTSQQIDTTCPPASGCSLFGSGVMTRVDQVVAALIVEPSSTWPAWTWPPQPVGDRSADCPVRRHRADPASGREG